MTYNRNILFITIIFILTRGITVAQPLTIVNNTHCKLHYSLSGSLGTPCGYECVVSGIIGSNKTIHYNNTGEINWPCNADIYYWRAFTLSYEGAAKIGNCNSGPPFSGTIVINTCNQEIEYAWNMDDNGDITVVISPVIIPRRKSSWALNMETIQGGVTFIVHPVMDISSYIDVSSDEKWMPEESFRIRTNQKFITTVYPANKEYRGDMPVLATDKSNLYNGSDVCAYQSLAGNKQLVSLTCFCGTDQVFNVTYNDHTFKVPMLYTVTEP